MKPAKITIEGDFWDCQIYRGRLYLWDSDGSLRTIDWHKLVESFIEEPLQELAINYAFLQGRSLYSSDAHLFFRDPEVKKLLLDRFSELANRQLNITSQAIDEFTIGHQNNPFKELQTDSEILNNKIYALTYGGFSYAKAHRRGKGVKPVGTRTTKLHDFVGYSLKVGSYARVALSGGDDGLLEYNAFENYSDYRGREPFRQITQKHSSFADFNYLSIYNSSIVGDSFMSLAKLSDGIEFKNAFHEKYIEKEFAESDIFGTTSRQALSWGTNEKIYQAINNRLRVVTFNNYDKTKEYFKDREDFVFHAWKGKILRGGTAYFGAIIECENALVVLTGENEFFNIHGAVTRWRVYPRSVNYENHLHVIQDDRIEIYSFNNDYFRNQFDKSFGMRFSE